MQKDECRMQNEDPKQRDLRVRTKRYALRNIRVFAAIKKSDDVGRVLGRQLLRSGTSVGAHYREACRARSVAEFVSKMEGGLQELDETHYWLELLVESGNIPSRRLSPLMIETEELLAIFVSSVKSAKKRRDR
jgi:four helix bundle protein